ncbi:hypothetical protein [Parasitella parasitica]|uniref:SET domain-containing protein n=1 Tax=Parasitella parasitica TaxID=35722 RepID=A0A0B7N2S4_9FUNG|nr:hypothetical protein [Parasitella parasitica]
MSKLKQKYPTKKKAHDRDDDNIEIEEQTDGDIIRCVCDDSDDDGFTIQCEHCENWQHASCVNIKKNNIPEHYMCDRCSRKFNRKDNQSRRRNSPSETDKKLKPNKLLKRSIPKKRVYHQDSEEEEEESEIHHIPPRISKTKFTPLSKSVFKEKLVEHLLIEVHRQWMESNKTKTASSSKNKPEFPSTSAAAAKGLESIVVMESNLLLPAIPKASVKPLKKSLRGSFLQSQKDPSVEKGVFADIHIPEHRYLMEVTGEYARKSEYKSNPDNNFALLATPPAHVFFFRAIDICIDARFAGNDARYIRRSCAPNSEIRSIILPNDSDDQTIHMGIYTSEEVDRGEEITIGWNWHRGYLMWHKNKEFLRQNHKVEIGPSEVDPLKQILSLIASEFGECACEDKDECLIECLKDELEKQSDGQHSPDNDTTSSSAKRKRLSHSNKSRGDNENHKRTKKAAARAGDIFSSDEDSKPKSRRNSLSSNKEEHKQVKLIKKSTAPRKKPVNAPASPTASQGDSVDVDIISMSPVPSQPASENELEPQASGYRRPKPFVPGDIRLPCKKRWLYRYLEEQRKKQLQEQQNQVQEPLEQVAPKTIQDDPKLPPTHSITHDREKAEQEDSSDGASSDSTLPLEDTPKIQHDEKASSLDQSATTTTQSPEQGLSSNTEFNDNNNVKSTDSIATQHEPESSSHVNQSDHKMEQVKQAKKKLSLQEYLLMRRGNLPTPDEKHSSTE